MPHLSTLNATLKHLECHTSHFFKCGILVTEMWHFKHLSVAFGELFFEDIGASALERLNAFISFRSFSIYISVVLDI